MRKAVGSGEFSTIPVSGWINLSLRLACVIHPLTRMVLTQIRAPDWEQASSLHLGSSIEAFTM
jgi:hypothetical protein